jgi:hypothetical protein
VLIVPRTPTKRSGPSLPLHLPPPHQTPHSSDSRQALAPRSDGKAIIRDPRIGLEVEGAAAEEAGSPMGAAPTLLLLLRQELEETTVGIGAGMGVLPLTLQKLVVGIRVVEEEKSREERVIPVGSIHGINRALSKIRGQSWSGSWVLGANSCEDFSERNGEHNISQP